MDKGSCDPARFGHMAALARCVRGGLPRVLLTLLCITSQLPATPVDVQARPGKAPTRAKAKV